jgi:hypothetical protein
MCLPARADELIDPDTFICAELVALTTSGLPPMFESLQMDGYTSAKRGNVIADPLILRDVLLDVMKACESRPATKVRAIWKETAESYTYDKDSRWKANTTTCAMYNDDEENGSGFVIWLDGYNRAKNDTEKSVLKDDDAIQGFLKACREKPESLVLDVLKESAK